MTFEQLQYFQEVYRLQSFTKTADFFYVSRSSLSLTIKKLEKELNITLFKRFANYIEPTEAAHEFYKYAQKILDNYSMLKQSMISYSLPTTSSNLQTIRLTIPELLIPLYGDALLELLSRQYPNISFDLLLDIKDNNFTHDYLKYDISIFLIPEDEILNYQSTLDSSYILKPIYPLPSQVWMSANSALNKYDIVPLDIIVKSPICIFTTSINAFNLLESWKTMCHFLNDETLLYTNSPSNLVKNVTQHGYCSLDYHISKDRLFLSDIFAGQNVVCKKTSLVYYLTIVYNEKLCGNFYHTITDFFFQIYTNATTS